MTDLSTGAAPPPDGVTPDFEHPEDVLHTINLVSGILGISVMAPFVIGRIFIKVHMLKQMVLEDYVCIVAWLLATGYFLTGLFMGMHGGGNHEYEISKDQRVGFGQALYADTIVYGPCAWTTKTTLLLIFARVFSPFKKAVKFIYVFIGLMFLYYFPVMVIKIKICTPIEGLWNPNVKATCINQSELFWTDTIMSATTDFVILVLPIPLVWSLQVPLKKKFRISILLGAGGIATGASIVRLILVFQPNSFADETVSFVRFNLLGVAEIGIGIICACLPAFNVFFIRYANSPHPSTSRKTNYSAEIKLSRLKTSSRSPTSHLQSHPRSHPRISNPLSRSVASYVEMRSPRDVFFVDLERGREEQDRGSARSLKSQLSVEAMSIHTRSLEGGGLDTGAMREFRKVHEWMQRPVFPDDGIGRAA